MAAPTPSLAQGAEADDSLQAVDQTPPAPTTTTTPAPTPVPAPAPAWSSKPHQQEDAQAEFSLPDLRLDIRKLVHPGASLFLGAVNVADQAPVIIRRILGLLYGSPSDPAAPLPPTRSVTFVLLYPHPGVADTSGDENKEIRFSLDYILKTSSSGPDRLRAEILGVLTHELVHCFQYNALGTCPGGLIEGIADWVRLRSDLAPPHWKREAGDKWDQGYQMTAYFLEYLDRRFGNNLVRRINANLRAKVYDEESFWVDLVGSPVGKLWSEYRQSLGSTAVRSLNSVPADDPACPQFCEQLTLLNSEKVAEQDATEAGKPDKRHLPN